MTTAARVASGRFSNRSVKNSNVMTVSAAAVMPDSCERAPGRPVDGRLREAPVDDHPADEPGPDVRRAEADQLTVGVDLGALASGIRLGRAETFGEADEHDSGRRTGAAR